MKILQQKLQIMSHRKITILTYVNITVTIKTIHCQQSIIQAVKYFMTPRPNLQCKFTVDN